MEINAGIRERRERVFLVLAGFFLCAMTMLNILGITRFVQLGPMSLAIGVLPYPLTFLCTDLISEIYGRARANFLVTVGLLLNGFIIATLWLANMMPSSETIKPAWQVIELAEEIALPTGASVEGSVELFTIMYALTSGAVFASMMAYMAAQYCDVYMFHFWKRLTKGRHLWLRNNASTIVSQGVDSFMVITVTFGAQFIAGTVTAGAMLVMMAHNYLFKLCVALADTPFFYLGSYRLKRYLELSDDEEDIG